MNRRFMIGSLGLTTLFGAARSALAQHEHHSPSSAAGAASPRPSNYAALMAATADCVAKGQTCLSHCIQLLSAGDKSVGKCAKTVGQLLPLCSALQALASQDSPHTRALAKVALEACNECAEACKQHVEHHAECKACYDSCLECIEQCKAIA